MDFDFKVTTWERITVPQEHEARVLKGIEDGEITCASDVWDICDDADLEYVDVPSEQMSVEENGGEATIEVIDNGGITIFQNNK